jgi:hypothetical protein
MKAFTRTTNRRNDFDRQPLENGYFPAAVGKHELFPAANRLEDTTY